MAWPWARASHAKPRPPRSTRGGPFLLIVCVRSHRCTGFKKRDTTEAALLARAASGLSLVAGERGGLISSRTARGVRVNLVLAMVLLPQTRPAESSAIPSDTGTGSRSRSHAAQARFFLAARRSEHGLVLSTRRLTSAMNNMCSALVTSAALGATHFAPHSAVC